MALVVPALLGLGIAAYEMSPVKESDVYWHIRAGRQLLADWTFAGPDPRGHVRHANLGAPSVSCPTSRWLDSTTGGGGRVSRCSSRSRLTFVFAAFWFVARRYATPLELAVLVVLALAGTSGSLTWRPQVLSFGFAAITAGAWYATSRDHRARWWLVPMTWLWACCHGFWFFVPALGLLVGAGMLLDRREWTRSEAPSSSRCPPSASRCSRPWVRGSSQRPLPSTPSPATSRSGSPLPRRTPPTS